MQRLIGDEARRIAVNFAKPAETADATAAVRRSPMNDWSDQKTDDPLYADLRPARGSFFGVTRSAARPGSSVAGLCINFSAGLSFLRPSLFSTEPAAEITGGELAPPCARSSRNKGAGFPIGPMRMETRA